jgi:hypothetical protein
MSLKRLAELQANILEAEGYAYFRAVDDLHEEAGSTDFAALLAEHEQLISALRGLVKHIGVTAVFQDVPEFNAARDILKKVTV